MSTTERPVTPEPAPLTSADLADENGWRDLAGLDAPDTLMLGALADWGIWPDDHAPDPREPLGDQFGWQIGPGEAVEYSECFDLIRAIAHSAYAAGHARGIQDAAD